MYLFLCEARTRSLTLQKQGLFHQTIILPATLLDRVVLCMEYWVIFFPMGKLYTPQCEYDSGKRDTSINKGTDIIWVITLEVHILPHPYAIGEKRNRRRGVVDPCTTYPDDFLYRWEKLRLTHEQKFHKMQDNKRQSKYFLILWFRYFQLYNVFRGYMSFLFQYH